MTDNLDEMDWLPDENYVRLGPARGALCADGISARGICSTHNRTVARLRDALAENVELRLQLQDAEAFAQKRGHQLDATEAKLAAVEALISEAEAGAGIVITPGFTTYYSVDTGLLRAALGAEAVTDQ